MDTSSAAARMAGLTNVAEWKRTQPAVRNPDQEVWASLSPVDRLAVWVTDHVGSMGFFAIIFIWTIGWLA